MLEMLLTQYEFQFGKPFPLKDYTDKSEIEIINILYACVQNNDPHAQPAPGENRFPNAPGL